MEYKILGLDVSKSSVTCCVLDGYPPGGLATYWKKTSRQATKNYPIFYSSTKKKTAKKTARDFKEWIADIKPDLACMEPTGQYSRLWAKILESEGVEIRWIGHMELKRFREGKNLPGHGKSDAVDALAIAAYPFDPECRTEAGEIDPRKFLICQPEAIAKLRDLVQQLNHLATVQSPAINYLRQRLSWEFPEVALVKSVSRNYSPALWAWLAGRPDICSKKGWTHQEKAWAGSIARELGTEISDITRHHANLLCDLDLQERRIEDEMDAIMGDPSFDAYNRLFDEFEMGRRIRSALLTRIFPFESFLVNGREWKGHEYREVKRAEKVFDSGKMRVAFTPGEAKRIRRNYSRDAFKMRIGRGTVLESSGDSWIEIEGGSSLCRQMLWLYVLTAIEPVRPDKLVSHSATVQELVEYRNSLKSQTDAAGKPLLSARHYQNKIMARVANLLYKGLAEIFAR